MIQNRFWVGFLFDRMVAYFCPTSIYACNLEVKVTDFNFYILNICFKSFMMFYHPNTFYLIWFIFCMAKILFCNISTHACDLEVKFTDAVFFTFKFMLEFLRFRIIQTTTGLVNI